MHHGPVLCPMEYTNVKKKQKLFSCARIPPLLRSRNSEQGRKDETPGLGQVKTQISCTHPSNSQRYFNTNRQLVFFFFLQDLILKLQPYNFLLFLPMLYEWIGVFLPLGTEEDKSKTSNHHKLSSVRTSAYILKSNYNCRITKMPFYKFLLFLMVLFCFYCLKKLSLFPVPGLLQRTVINSWKMTSNTLSR